jgi:hypothetical protein
MYRSMRTAPTVVIFAALSLLALPTAGCDSGPDTIGTPPYTKGYTPGGASASSNVGGTSNVGVSTGESTSSSSELMNRLKNQDGGNR